MQCVEVGGTRSDFEMISCGVPQGSILGPLLFLIYINDMKASIECRLSLYADDSALLFSHKNIDVINENLSTALSSCKRWLVDNMLSLYLGKTECLLFGSKRKLKKGCESFRVTCEGRVIDRVFSVRYLGVQLDSSLDGSSHVGKILKMCSDRLSFLYRNSAFLDQQCRKTLCSALIQPHLDYCCSSWYSSLTVALKTRLDVIQRKMVRFIYGMEIMAHVDLSNLYDLSWLSVPDRVTYFKLLHIFRIRNGLAPRYLMTNFRSISDAHTHNTRGSDYNYFVSKNLARSQNSFAYTAIRSWNSLSVTLKSISDIHIFKRKLKTALLARYTD